MKPQRRGLWLHAAVLIVFFGLAVPGAWLQAQRALGPLDLAALDRTSTVALDRDGRLLRAFETAGRALAPAIEGEGCRSALLRPAESL